MQKLPIPQALEGKPIDLALKDLLGISRAKAQSLIKEGRVLLNNATPNAHALVTHGAEIQVEPEEKPRVLKRPTKKQATTALKILYEDTDVLVVNKPTGLLIHPAPGKSEQSLTDLLVAYHPQIKKVGDPKRPGIVHRLDKEVSGVVIVAKTPKAYDWLKEQFSERRVEKSYVALVYGHLPKQADTIRLKIARSERRARMAARPESQEGKEAVTHYEVIKQFGTHDLVQIRIETGRTHQIRAHFFAIGHPIVGDPLYRSKRYKPVTISRVALHAESLTITLPSGEKKTFSVPRPEFLPKLYVLTGPSGVGKTTVAYRLLTELPQLRKVITCTTRPKREGEKQDVDYHFVTKPAFEKIMEHGELFEWDHHYGYWYGNRTQELEELLHAGYNVLLVVDVNGARTIRKNRPDACIIFLTVDSLDDLTARILSRGSIKKEELAGRVEKMREELRFASQSDLVVPNPKGKFEKTVTQVK